MADLQTRQVGARAASEKVLEVKKLGLLFAAIIVIALVVFSFSNSGGGGGVGIGSMTSGGDANYIKKRTLEFLEDIQFKDFDKAASYHSSEDRKDLDISKLIERLFLVKPEFLDILRFKVVKSEIDSTGDRGRVLTSTTVKYLNSGKVKDSDVIFYWYRDPTEGWVMKLESSLH